MPVAKSFAEFEILCEPYNANGKMYIQVRNPKTNTIRTVRWYTEQEYNKLYPEAPIIANNKVVKTQKEVLGFAKGYITIFKGEIDEPILEWFQEKTECRYTRWWGWYIMSTENLPSDLPSGITPVQLPWELVGKEDGSLKLESEVAENVDSLLYNDSPSEYIGSIGERLELSITITALYKMDNGFNGAASNLHIMEDKDGNVFTWTTSAKSWSVGTEKVIRGTVKEHKLYKGVKQTVLTRCMERS